jgi:DNA modification methylase
MEKLLPADEKYDMLFTCPPYYDLERYSDGEADGSAKQTYSEFLEWYHKIFLHAVGRLRDNRFAVVVVGEIRDKQGVYRNFVGHTVACFKRLGLNYYNEAILITAVGSLPIRTGKQFSVARKMGKTHQNVLCFYKGDVAEIRNHFPQEIQGI